MKLVPALVFSCIITIIFLALFNLEPGLSHDSSLSMQQAARAFQTMDKLYVEINYNFQLHKKFNQLQQQLSEEIDLLIKTGREPEYLAKALPKHDLTIVKVDTNGETLGIADLSGSLDNEFIRSYVRLYTLHIKSLEKAVFYSDEYKAEVEACDVRLREILRSRGDSVAVMQLRAARMATFSSEKGFIGFYWDHQNLPGGEKAFFFCRLNLDRIDIAMPYREAIKNHTDEQMGSLFYSLEMGDFIREGVPEKTLRRPVLKYLKSYLSKVYDKSADNNQDTYYTTYSSGDEYVVIGREIAEKRVVPIVIIDMRSHASVSLARNENVILFSVICVGFWLFMQTMVFGRGIRLNVGKTLIATSLLAICMPFMMGRSIFQLILREAKENERLKLERSLYNTLNGVDSGVRLFHANLFQNFVQVLKRRENIAGLQAAQEKQFKISPFDLQKAETDPTDGAKIVERISRDSFLPFEDAIDRKFDNRKRVNAIMILGSHGFMRFFDRFSGFVVGHKKESSADSMLHTLNLYRRTIEPFFSRNEMAPGLSSSDKGRENELTKYLYDELKAQLVATLGADKFLEIFTRYEGLNTLRTSVGNSHFSVFPLWADGIISFFCGIGWDEYTISDIYLRTVFQNIEAKKNAENSTSGKTFLKYFDPAFHFPKDQVFLQGFGGMRGDTISSEGNDSPVLGSLIKESYRSKRPLRLVLDDTIHQVSPGKYFALYTTGGSQNTSHLLDIEKWRSRLFIAGLLLFIMFALFAAVNISRSFTSPLEHLLWGIERVEKNDFDVRLKDSREDEFGSISRAFNFMIRRLREKETLGKFVSDSVRRLARDPELLKKAQQGSEEEVTIVFANLEGFVEFAAKTDAQEVQNKLEFCLGAFFTVAEESGGEIDKVIGEKLLIVFPHARVGMKQATASAVGLVQKIRTMFHSEANLKPVFGINNGRVISGIIGTASVRMDNTIIGDPVNVAARLCSIANAESSPVIISGEVKEALGGAFKARAVNINRIRGKHQEVEVFSLEA